MQAWLSGGQILIRSTSLLVRILTLFAFDRLVVVDGRARTVHVFETRWWKRRLSRRIGFSEIDHIGTGYRAGTRPSGAALLAGGARMRDMDYFRLTLVLKKRGEEVYLGEIAGEDNTLSRKESAAESEFQQVLAILRRTLGVSVGQKVEYAARADGTLVSCTGCGRPNGPGQRKCLYCGGELFASRE
jgi:hypothetical protein